MGESGAILEEEEGGREWCADSVVRSGASSSSIWESEFPKEPEFGVWRSEEEDELFRE
jgi:hypothetical protein